MEASRQTGVDAVDVRVLREKPLDNAAAAANRRDAAEGRLGVLKRRAHQRQQRIGVCAVLGPAHQKRAAELRHQAALVRLSVVVPLVA